MARLSAGSGFMFSKVGEVMLVAVGGASSDADRGDLAVVADETGLRIVLTDGKGAKVAPMGWAA